MRAVTDLSASLASFLNKLWASPPMYAVQVTALLTTKLLLLGGAVAARGEFVARFKQMHHSG